jgi:trans-2,3-dihydro-3-hydroxyanthranilate isomerase
MSRAYLHYDVFTGQPFLGNQLAVFTDASGLESGRMQQIAREMTFSESTFILPAEHPETGVRMRIFTPFEELPMAGHPTIGSTFALAHTGVIPPGSQRFVFGLGVGPTPVDLEWDGDRLRFAWMTQGLPEFGPVVEAVEAVAEALGLMPADLADGLPVQQVSCGVSFLFVPLRDLQTVDRAFSDVGAFRRLGDAMGMAQPIFLFAVLPSGGEETVYSRMFAPSLGITEDPATGGASGPLGCYLVRHGVVRGDSAQRIVSVQGVAMGRASRIHVAIGETDGVISSVKVGGRAVLVGRGELFD